MTEDNPKEQQTTTDRCDCGARLKYKCSKHGGHKMCAESLVEGSTIGNMSPKQSDEAKKPKLPPPIRPTEPVIRRAVNGKVINSDEIWNK